VNKFIVKDAFDDIRKIAYDSKVEEDHLVIRFIVSTIEKISVFGQFIDVNNPNPINPEDVGVLQLCV